MYIKSANIKCLFSVVLALGYLSTVFVYQHLALCLELLVRKIYYRNLMNQQGDSQLILI